MILQQFFLKAKFVMFLYSQCSPYVICLFFIPVHYFTHVVAVFLTGIWATYIHDAALGNIEPIMGSKYHTVHHTHYHYNFGQVRY